MVGETFFEICQDECQHMDVSENRGTPKWMVYNENLIKMDDLGVPPFKETPISIMMLLYLFERHVNAKLLKID